jgi:hypothetical protein
MSRKTQRVVSYVLAFFASTIAYYNVATSETVNGDTTARAGLGIFIGLIVGVIVLICCASYFTRNE